MDDILVALPKMVECAALLVIGYQLRQNNILRISDGEGFVFADLFVHGLDMEQTAFRLAVHLTLPAVIFQRMSKQPALAPGALVALTAAGICFATQAAASWIFSATKSKRERAVITGSTVGLSLHLFGYPVVEAFMGPAGIPPLVLFDLVNTLAVVGASYMLFASAGPAFPESYPHEDGGTYRGQWRGLRKEGLGVYTYASGAKYEGEWRDNVKDGRGVYYYPKGGTYEGEWSHGLMSGVGVRTMASGQVKSGRWRDNQLVEPLDLWQCAYAAEGAAEVALAARRVEVGGGKLSDILQQLVLSPPFWAALVALPINLLQLRLPPSIELVTATLAPANTPLMLLAAGILTTLELPPPRVALDVYQVVATRLIVPLFVGATLLAAVTPSVPGAAMPLAATLLAFLAPTHPQLVALPLMCLLGLAAAADSRAVLTAMSSSALPGPAAAAAMLPSAPYFTIAAGFAAVAALGVALAYLNDRKRGAAEAQQYPALAGTHQRVRMVYSGTGGTGSATGITTSNQGLTSVEGGSGNPGSISTSTGSAGGDDAGTGPASGSALRAVVRRDMIHRLKSWPLWGAVSHSGVCRHGIFPMLRSCRPYSATRCLPARPFAAVAASFVGAHVGII